MTTKDADARREEFLGLIEEQEKLLSELSDKLSDLIDMVERTFPFNSDDDYLDSDDDFDKDE